MVFHSGVATGYIVIGLNKTIEILKKSDFKFEESLVEKILFLH